MGDPGRILIAVLLVLSITAILLVVGITLVKSNARSLEQARESRDTEA